MVASGWEEGEQLTGLRFLSGVMKMFWNWVTVMAAQLCEHTKLIEFCILSLCELSENK